MNEKIVEEIYFIKEEDYQELKMKIDRKEDYFSLTELQIFTEKVGAILVQFI